MEIKAGQSILDIALQKTGIAENALDVAIANEILITEELTTGDEIYIPENIEKDIDVLATYKEKQIIPATSITQLQEALNPSGGVEYMGIEIDFIVS